MIKFILRNKDRGFLGGISEWASVKGIKEINEIAEVEEKGEVLVKSVDQVERIVQLIDEFLDFKRVESLKQWINYRPFDKWVDDPTPEDPDNGYWLYARGTREKPVTIGKSEKLHIWFEEEGGVLKFFSRDKDLIERLNLKEVYRVPPDISLEELEKRVCEIEAEEEEEEKRQEERVIEYYYEIIS